MKSIKNMTQAELAAYVHSQLQKVGIDVILSGGAAVGIFTNGKYVSRDIDLINVKFAQQEIIEEVMEKMGFISVGRHFEHPQTDQIIEFPPGPLLFGNARVDNIIELEFDSGILRVISPTDCVKDRLAHYFHWGDRQCLAQAIMVIENHEVDFDGIKNWSKMEGKLSEFDKIRSKLFDAVKSKSNDK